MEPTFNCRCCGHCCLSLIDAYNGCVSDDDLDRWHQHDRFDILAWVQTLDLGPTNKLHAAWVDPETGDDVERCPWLIDRLDRKGHLCGIEEIKPDHCRAYPEHRRHAESTGCRAYQNKEHQVDD
jgi:Fe-S-cluster containining protein